MSTAAKRKRRARERTLRRRRRQRQCVFDLGELTPVSMAHDATVAMMTHAYMGYARRLESLVYDECPMLAMMPKRPETKGV